LKWEFETQLNDLRTQKNSLTQEKGKLESTNQTLAKLIEWTTNDSGEITKPSILNRYLAQFNADEWNKTEKQLITKTEEIKEENEINKENLLVRLNKITSENLFEWEKWSEWNKIFDYIHENRNNLSLDIKENFMNKIPENHKKIVYQDSTSNLNWTELTYTNEELRPEKDTEGNNVFRAEISTGEWSNLIKWDFDIHFWKTEEQKA